MATLGRDFIKMIAPVLGLQSVKGIRSIAIRAAHNDVTSVDIECIPSADFNGVTVNDVTDCETVGRKFIVEVTEVVD